MKISPDVRSCFRVEENFANSAGARWTYLVGNHDVVIVNIGAQVYPAHLLVKVSAAMWTFHSSAPWLKAIAKTEAIRT